MHIIAWFMIPDFFVSFWGIASVLLTVGGFAVMFIGGGMWIEPKGSSNTTVTKDGKTYNAPRQIDLMHWDSVKTTYNYDTGMTPEEIGRNNHKAWDIIFPIGAICVLLGVATTVAGYFILTKGM